MPIKSAKLHSHTVASYPHIVNPSAPPVSTATPDGIPPCPGVREVSVPGPWVPLREIWPLT